MSGLIDYNDSEFDSFLTNQKLSDNFNSRFDLVLYAIALSKKAVSSGRGKVVVGNLSYDILKELYNKKIDPQDPLLNVPKSRKVVSKSSKRVGIPSKSSNNLDFNGVV